MDDTLSGCLGDDTHSLSWDVEDFERFISRDDGECDPSDALSFPALSPICSVTDDLPSQAAAEPDSQSVGNQWPNDTTQMDDLNPRADTRMNLTSVSPGVLSSSKATPEPLTGSRRQRHTTYVQQLAKIAAEKWDSLGPLLDPDPQSLFDTTSKGDVTSPRPPREDVRESYVPSLTATLLASQRNATAKHAFWNSNQGSVTEAWREVLEDARQVQTILIQIESTLSTHPSLQSGQNSTVGACDYCHSSKVACIESTVEGTCTRCALREFSCTANFEARNGDPGAHRNSIRRRFINLCRRSET